MVQNVYFCGMKRLFPLVILLSFLMLSCDRYAKYDAMFRPIDSLAKERPDSALRLLEAMKPRIGDAPGRIKAYYGLMRTKYMLNAGVRFTSDSAIRAVAGYYDRHGDDNHRMFSKLLLGCVNRNMGDNTEAMLCLEAAAAGADTTSADCLYAVLGQVYAHLSQVYLDEYMPRNVIRASQLCYRNSMKAGDTLTALSGLDHISNAYIFMGQPDSALAVTLCSSRLFRESGYVEASAISQAKLIEIYLDRGDTANAARCMAVFDRDSRVIGVDGNAKPDYQGIYYVKAIYSVCTNRLDSAAYWLNKIRQIKQPTLVIREALAYGLWQMYDKMGAKDSALKYATVSSELSDSLTKEIMKNTCSVVQAQYERTNLRGQVTDKALEAERMKTTALAVVLVLLVVLSVFTYIIRKRREEMRCRELRHRHDIDALTRAQTDLQQLLTLTEEERDALAKEKREAIERLQSLETLQRHVDEATVEERLANADIARRFRQMALNPTAKPTAEEWQALRSMVNSEVPGFYSTLNNGHVLRPDEYNLCMLLRLHFKPLEISNLTGISQKNVSAMRRRLLQKVLGRDGKPGEFDDFITGIVR